VLWYDGASAHVLPGVVARRYNDNVGGVLCSYSHVGIPRSGLVVGSIPFIHFFVAVKVRCVWVFRAPVWPFGSSHHGVL